MTNDDPVYEDIWLKIFGPAHDDAFLICPNKDGNIVLSKAAVEAINQSLKDDIKCSHCGGKCCANYVDVYESDQVYYDDELTTVHNGQRVMKAVYGDCIALKNGRCSIYDKRPSVCRLFEFGGECCKQFFFGEKLSHTCKQCQVTNKAICNK